MQQENISNAAKQFVKFNCEKMAKKILIIKPLQRFNCELSIVWHAFLQQAGVTHNVIIDW